MAHQSDEFVIKRAERTQVRLRIALQGSSGGGKTATSLLLAKGMVAELERRGVLPSHLDCHIGLLDTERDSAKLYSHLVPFDTIVLQPPYTTQRYLKALGALERAGYSVIIVDQITHEWFGEGGILAQVQAASALNDFAKWNGPSQDHEVFIDTLLKSPAHLIVTMRSKTAWVLEDEVGRDGKTRKKPKRIGMAAKQREGTEYEFTTLLDLEVGTNAATCLKDRTELFTINESVGRMGADWGKKLIEWVYSAKAVEPVETGPSPEERCIAIADAGIRACERAPNLPDLQTAYTAQVRAVRAFQTTAGADIVKREEERITAAKDARKVSLGSIGGNPVLTGEPISATDLVNLEMLLSDSGVLAADLKTQFSVPRLAVLPLGRWDDVVQWIIAAAGERGISLRPVKHVPDPEEASPPPGPLEVTNGIIEKIAEERGGLFTGFKDDLPWDGQGAQRSS